MITIRKYIARWSNRDAPHGCRFAIATLLPKNHWQRYFTLIQDIQDHSLLVKFHLSLHFTNEINRKEWMPAAMSIDPAIAALEFYRALTGQSVEIHYALIEGVNDFPSDAETLGLGLRNRAIPVKLLKYNERKAISYRSSGRVEMFTKILDKYCIPHEYYEPPGIDVGASCGQFLLDHYLKYNKSLKILAEEAAIGLGLLLEGRKDTAPVHLMLADSVLKSEQACRTALGDARKYRSSDQEQIDKLKEVLLKYHRLTKEEDKKGIEKCSKKRGS
jgi:hypothetical protein